MKRKMILTLIGTVFTSLVQADQPMNSETTQPPAYVSGEKVKTGQLPGGYSESASYKCADGWDIFITGDYLYWDWTQSSFLLATTTPLVDDLFQGSTGSRTTSYQTPGYASGFQVGLGFNMPGMDDWNIYSEYTWYRNSNTSSVTSADGNILVLPDAASLSVDKNLKTLDGTFTSQVQMHYDSLDFLLKRPFYFGKKLTANFGAGLRALWISQEVTRTMDGFNGDDYVDSIYRVATTSPSTWSLGPKFSFESNWLLGYGIQIMMNLSSSVLYTRYTMSNSGTTTITEGRTTSSENFDWNEIDNINALRFITEAFLGLGWNKGFCDNQFRFALSAGYDFDIFWNYDMLYYPTSQTRGDMLLQGLNIQARFDF